jgi:hypothetical protein
VPLVTNAVSAALENLSVVALFEPLELRDQIEKSQMRCHHPLQDFVVAAVEALRPPAAI